MNESRKNEPTTRLIDEAIQEPDRRAAAKLLTARGVGFTTVVRVLDQEAPRRTKEKDLVIEATQVECR